MSTKKNSGPRIIAVALKSRTDAERVVREAVALQLDLEAAIVERDREVEAVQGRHNTGIDALNSRIEEKMAVLEQWAQTNPQEFQARSAKVAGHTLGWRLGNHAAKALKGFTWAKVLEKLRASRRSVRDRFIRIKEEPNKEAMIEARSHPKLLARFGVEIVQGETFYLDPNREGQADAKLQSDRREVAAA